MFHFGGSMRSYNTSKAGSVQLRNFIRHGLFCSLSIASLVGCQQTHDLHDMHDSTDKMEHSTEKMSDHLETTDTNTAKMPPKMDKMIEKLDQTITRLDGVASTSNEIADRAKNLPILVAKSDEIGTTIAGFCNGAGSAVPFQVRDLAMKQLYEGDPDPAGKLAAAGGYFSAFDYQQWHTCGPSDVSVRATMMAAATKEFTLKLRQFATSPKPQPLAQRNALGLVPIPFNLPVNSDENKAQTLNSLAAAVDQVHYWETLTIEKLNIDALIAGEPNDFKIVNMYSMIKDAFRFEKRRNAGQAKTGEMQPFMENILAQRVSVLRLLQARHNFFAAVFLASAKDRSPSTNKLSFKISVLLGEPKPWTLSLDSYTIEQLKDLSDYLKLALETRKFLVEILGDKSKLLYDEHLIGILDSMNMTASLTPDSRNSVEIVTARKKLIGLVGLLRAR
jgi:hypothetical protein